MRVVMRHHQSTRAHLHPREAPPQSPQPAVAAVVEPERVVAGVNVRHRGGRREAGTHAVKRRRRLAGGPRPARAISGRAVPISGTAGADSERAAAASGQDLAFSGLPGGKCPRGNACPPLTHGWVDVEEGVVVTGEIDRGAVAGEQGNQTGAEAAAGAVGRRRLNRVVAAWGGRVG